MTAAIRTSLPVEAWPKTDRLLWRAAQQKGGIFDPDGAAAHWAEATSTQVAKGYGKWLWALQFVGVLDPELTPSARITEDHLRRFVDVLQRQGLASTSIASRVTDLMEALRVMEPKADLTLLRGLVSTLQQRARPTRNKASRIRVPSEIWEACAEEMSGIAVDPTPPSLEVSSRYRDALALGFLVWSPIRRRNLAALNLGDNLCFEAGRWRVGFGPEATKDKAPLAFTLPADETYQECFTHYLIHIRPCLMRRPNIKIDALLQERGPLWISTRGRAMTAHALYYAVTRCSERLLGAPLNPHLLRDCAASAITSERPEYVLAAARILGHSQLSTTLAHYEQASMLGAGERLGEVVEEIKARQDGTNASAARNHHASPFYNPWDDI